MRQLRSGGEVAFLHSLRSRAGAEVRRPLLQLGIGDDCAVLRPPPGHDLLVTTDFSLENRHFWRDTHPASSVGHRCLARGLSDIAAMGGKPLAAFLSLALPSGFLASAKGRRWVDGFLDGLFALASEAQTPLAGGDTSAAPADLILADIVVTGSAPRGRELRRSGAKPRDCLYVTGALGGAAAELQALLPHPRRFRGAASGDSHPHLFPRPRLAVGMALLRRSIATAAIDISDGLSTDLQHLCEASGVAAVLHAESLPIHPAALPLGPAAALQAALHGGEDYELLFTAGTTTAVPRSLAGVPVTKIGSIEAGTPAIRLREPGKPEAILQPGGWEHSI